MALRGQGSGLSNGPAASVPDLPHNALLSFLPNDGHSQDKQERKRRESKKGDEKGRQGFDMKQQTGHKKHMCTSQVFLSTQASPAEQCREFKMAFVR